MSLVYANCGENFGLRAFDLSEAIIGECLEDTTGFAFGVCTSIHFNPDTGRGTITTEAQAEDVRNGFGDEEDEIILLPFIPETLYKNLIHAHFDA